VDITLPIALTVVFCAYFLKGFSAFGPALLIIPSFTVLYSPYLALSYSGIFDVLAGGILIATVFKTINWRFVSSISFFLLIGTYIGVYFVGVIPASVLKLLIALILIFFIIVFLSEEKILKMFHPQFSSTSVYALSIFSGIVVGMVGAGGALLIIYLKLEHKKVEFRSQLIAIFLISALWRSFLYYHNGFMKEIDETGFYMIPFLILGLLSGHFLQKKTSERKFNKLITLILLIPVFTLIGDLFI